jgi:hypothetical protein
MRKSSHQLSVVSGQEMSGDEGKTALGSQVSAPLKEEILLVESFFKGGE